MSGEGHFERGIALCKRGEFRAALKAFTNAQKQGYDWPSAQYRRGDALYLLGDPKRAAELLLASLKRFGERPNEERDRAKVFIRLADCAQRELQEEARKSHLKEALGILANLGALPNLLGFEAELNFWKGTALRELSKRAGAEEAFALVLDFKSTDSEVLERRGNAHAYLGSSEAKSERTTAHREAALEEFAAALRQSPAAVPELETRIGEVLMELECPKRAIEAYRRALGASPSFRRAHRELGHALALNGEYKLAAEEFTFVLDALPASNAQERLLAHRDRGLTHLRECKYDAARADFAEAANIEPRDALPQWGLARALLALGRSQQAREPAEKASSLAQEQSDSIKGWAEYLLALLLGQRGDHAAALGHLRVAREAAIRRSDTRLQAHAETAQGLYLAQIGRLVDARAACRKAIDLNPKSFSARAVLAWICNREGELGEAETHIERAVELVEQDARLDCGSKRARWHIYLLGAAIFNGVAELYDDASRAEDAIDITSKAREDIDRFTQHTDEDRERAALVSFEQAHAQIILGRWRKAQRALRQCERTAQRNTRPWLAARRALAQEGRPVMIPPLLIILLALGATVGLVTGLLTKELDGSSFTVLILSAWGLALAARVLPELTKLNIGAVQIEKVVASASATALINIPPPPPRPQLKEPRLQVIKY